MTAPIESLKVTNVDGLDFIDLDDGKAQIKKEWEELSLMISCGRGPQDWMKLFDDSNLSDALK